MADETVEIDVNIDVNTNEAEGSFTRLQTQIRETRTALQAAAAAGDSVNFSKLKGQLDGLEDSLEIVTLKQVQFDDALAAAPGPIGKAGQALKGFDGVLKLLAANPIVAILAGLAAVLTAVIGALSKTKEGTAALTAVTDAFGNILQPVIKFISDAAVPVFEKFAEIINFFGTSLGLVDEKVVKAKEEFRKLELQVKQNNAQIEGEIALMEAQGKGIDKIAEKKKQQIDNEIKLLVKKKESFGEITADEEAQIIALNLKKKIIDAEVAAYEKKRDEEKAKEALKKRQDAFNKEIEQIGKDLKVRTDLNNKYLTEEKFRLDKAKAEGLLTEVQYQEQLFDAQKITNDSNLVEQDRFFNIRREKLKAGLAANLITQKEYDVLSTEALIETTNAKDAIIKTGYDQEIGYINNAAKALTDLQNTQITINENIAQSWIELGNTIGSSIGTLATVFEQGSAAQKAFAIASVVINGAAAAGKILLDAKENISSATKVISQGVAAKAQGIAVAPLNPVIGGALIAAGTAATTAGGALLAKAKTSAAFQLAAVGVTTGAQIAAILGAGKGKTSGGATASAGGGEGGGGTPAFSTPTIGAPQIGATSAQQGQLAGIVAGALDRNNSEGRPIRAYVIGNDITTEQQLQRRIRTSARLGG
jgi:hypothetical protein